MLRGEQPVQGTPRQKVVSLRLGFGADDFGYAIDLGLPSGPTGAFGHDPEIKRECLWAGPRCGPRRCSSIAGTARQGAGRTERSGRSPPISSPTFDSMMTHCADPRSTPEMLMLRETMRAWRFYDHFRTDAAAPARLPQIGTHTPVLSHDGADLAAALQTIRQIGDTEALDAAIADAFPGSQVSVTLRRGLVRGRDAAARTAAAAEGRRALRRHAALPAVGRRAADAASARPAGAERAGNQPASRSAAGARAAHRAGRRAHRRSSSSRMRRCWSMRCSRTPDCHSITLEKEFGQTRVAGDDHERPRMAVAGAMTRSMVLDPMTTTADTYPLRLDRIHPLDTAHATRGAVSGRGRRTRRVARLAARLRARITGP